MTDSANSLFQCVRGRPLPREPLSFFQYKQGNRLCVTMTDSVEVWRDDLVIGERLFADFVVCGMAADRDRDTNDMNTTKDILKQRMKYPGAKEDKAIETIAKTWILPTKVSLGPTVEEVLSFKEGAVGKAFEDVFTAIKSEDKVIHFLKLEFSDANKGVERYVVSRVLDEGFRPSLLLVKWSHDADDHIPTAHAAGHLMNSGYSLVGLENGYSLYMFTDQVLYDICSMKQPSLKNPMMESILQSVSESKLLSTQSKDGSTPTLTVPTPAELAQKMDVSHC